MFPNKTVTSHPIGNWLFPLHEILNKYMYNTWIKWFCLNNCKMHSFKLNKPTHKPLN